MTSFQQTVTTLSLHNQISTPTTTSSLQHLKSLLPSKKYPLLLRIKFCEKPAFTNYSHYRTNPRLPLHTSQPTHKVYNATALLTHPWSKVSGELGNLEQASSRLQETYTRCGPFESYR